MTPDNNVATTDKVASEIKLLSTIAKANGSLLSLQDLMALTRNGFSEEVEREETNIDLASQFRLLDGFVLEQNERYAPSILDREREKRVRADSYSSLAREFASFLECKESSLIAVSGSTSYKTVSEKDDLDFFCVTGRESLWIFVTRALLLGRVFRLCRRNTPRLCFSYVADEGYAQVDFNASDDALFARDALTAKVISGKEYYAHLLNNSPWIGNYFPRLYQLRTKTEIRENGAPTIQEPQAPAASRRFLNLLLFHLVGSYIALKSFLLNCKFRKQNNSSSAFEVKIGSDHCIFESVRYNHLRTLYAPLNSKSAEKRRAIS